MVGVLRHLPSRAYVFEMCRKKSRAKLFGQFVGTLGVIGGHLYEVWEVYGDPMGVIGGHMYEVWERYGDPCTHPTA